MRLALMLLAAIGLVMFVKWMRLRIDDPELVMIAESGPDEPPRILGRVIQIGRQGSQQLPQDPRPPQTEQERWQWQRDFHLQLYPNLGEALQLDAKTTSDLYDLLARQAMEYPDDESAQAIDRLADRKDAQLKGLLGETAFERFDSYRGMPAARDVARLNETLGESQRVRGEAIWRLAQLIHVNSIYGRSGPLASSSFQVMPPEVAGSFRSQALIDHAKREDHFRIEERWRSRIEAEAVGFLTPAQFDALKRWHEQTAASWRSSLGSTRSELGLPAEIPKGPEAMALGVLRRRAPIEGDIRTEFTLTVNGESVRIDRSGPNRERFAFKAGSGLQAEAIATLYDDGWLELLLVYNEIRRGKPRPLDQWVQIESPTRQENGAPAAPHDSVMETRRGLMEYQIQATGITARLIKSL